jgi:hypothetical protein
LGGISEIDYLNFWFLILRISKYWTDSEVNQEIVIRFEEPSVPLLAREVKSIRVSDRTNAAMLCFCPMNVRRIGTRCLRHKI